MMLLLPQFAPFIGFYPRRANWLHNPFSRADQAPVHTCDEDFCVNSLQSFLTRVPRMIAPCDVQKMES